MRLQNLGLVLVLGVLLASALPAAAQQANQNIPVLPVVPNAGDPDWFLKGDGYLQRQVEPTIAVSTRNPDHLLAFFNDYRAVDVPDDEGLGEGSLVAALALDTVDLMMAGLLPGLGVSLPPALPMAAAEAWVGGSRSYDGGLTWAGMFMPGAPFDNSPASLASPVWGLEAATDPVAVSGPCGYVYVVFVAFTRGGQSKMAVARFQDLNNSEGGDTWEYQGTTVLETGNNATNGYFLDKPHINLDVWRGAGAADQCSHRVYVSYSTFNGLSKDGKVQSKLNFAKSENGGLSYTTTKINKNWGQNQGSFITVDPRPGTPSNQGGPGTIYVVWRHFFDPDTIIMTRSTNFGSTWSNPVSIIGSVPMAPFDQPTISTEFANPDWLSFRSNAFPTAAVSGDGTVFVAWQERVNITPGTPGVGRPQAGGSPRIVMMRSTNGGGSWSDVTGAAGARSAVDFGDRDLGEVPEPGFGALPDARPSGPQVMPWLSFGGGRLALVYYESRGFLGGVDGIGIQHADLSPGTGFISGIDRVVDFRAALLNTSTGQLLGTSQISRYPISAGADFGDGVEDVADIATVLPELCAAGGAPEYCQPSLNLMNKPQSGAGGSPFMGDYTGATPAVPFVYDESLAGWRWATEPEDVPTQAFHTIFADNRNLIPPTDPTGSPEWQRYQFYGPPGIGGACYNPGSRNTDVLTARLNAELIVSTPTTFKQLDARRGFPIRVQNGTADPRFYRLSISQGLENASFSVDESADIDSGDIEVFPYSSVSQVVYVDAGSAGSIRVDVIEIDGIDGFEVPGGQAGSVVFNPDPNNPSIDGLGTIETQDPFVLNPFVLNPFVLNPFVLNEGAANFSVSNPFVLNPFVLNPFVLNSSVYDVVDTTWEVGPSSLTNTAGSYVPVVNIDNAEQYVGNYAFQLIVYKTSSFASANQACELAAISQDQVLSNVAANPFVLNPFVLNPFVLNPFVLNEGVENPFVLNPFVLNPFVLNSTFTMAPPDGEAAKRTTAKGLGVADDGTLRAPRAADAVKLTLRAYRIKPFCDEPGADQNACIQPGTDLVYNPFADPPSAAVGSLSCVQAKLGEGSAEAAAECFDYVAPDLVPVYDDSLNANLTVDAGGSLDFPVGGWTLVNQGTADATAENRALRHGFYLTTDPSVEFDGDGNATNAQLLASVTSVSSTLAAGAQENFLAYSLTIPSNLSGGAYNLILYVDDLEEVSEIDEINNKITAVVPIFVTAPNAPPTADDQNVTTAEDTAVAITLSGSDADGDPLSFTIVSGPANGTLSGDAPALTYTPILDFNGGDSFTFTVNDGEYDSAPATVAITVSAVNDPPVVQPATLQVNEDGSAVGSLSVSDPDGDTSFTYAVSSPPSSGTASFASPTSGSFTYTPGANFNGSDQFTVTVTDAGGAGGSATVTVTVTAVNDSPVAFAQSVTTSEDLPLPITLGALDVDGDPLSWTVVGGPTGGVLTGTAPDLVYTPALNFFGSDSFSFKVSDGELDSNVATVSISIVAARDYIFLGLQSPWTPPSPPYTVKVGSSVPLKWQYAAVGDPGASPINSAAFLPRVRVTGPFSCAGPEAGDTNEFPNFPGASNYQYDSKTFTHQFNWDTNGGVIGSCYNIRVFTPDDGVLDGPFIIRLKR